MIVNIDSIEKKFLCNKIVADYLIFECGLPVLSYDEHYYYFADTDKLRECMSNMPLNIRIHSTFDEFIYIIFNSSKERR